MEILLEKPLPIIAVAAVLATFFGVVFLSRRNLISLVGLGAVLLFTFLLLVTERLIVTPREEVEVAVEEILDGIEANDVQRVLALVDPSATQIRSDIETLMSMVKVEATGAAGLNVECEGREPTDALAKFKGLFRGVHANSGILVPYSDQVELHWKRSKGQWLLDDFTAYWKGKPLNAVSSLRGTQPAAVTR